MLEKSVVKVKFQLPEFVPAHSVEPKELIISEKSHFLKSNMFLHKSAHIDFTHQIQKEFSKFNYFYACSVKMCLAKKKMLFQLVLHIEKKIENIFSLFLNKKHIPTQIFHFLFS